MRQKHTKENKKEQRHSCMQVVKSQNKQFTHFEFTDRRERNVYIEFFACSVCTMEIAFTCVWCARRCISFTSFDQFLFVTDNDNCQFLRTRTCGALFCVIIETSMVTVLFLGFYTRDIYHIFIPRVKTNTHTQYNRFNGFTLC